MAESIQMLFGGEEGNSYGPKKPSRIKAHEVMNSSDTSYFNCTTMESQQYLNHLGCFSTIHAHYLSTDTTTELDL